MELSEETMHVLEEMSIKKDVPIDECLEFMSTDLPE